MRQIRPGCADGTRHMLLTNMMVTERFPVALFADPYHESRSIEEVFKGGGLKHRLNIEAVSGRSRLAGEQNFSTNVLSDNLAAAFILAARDTQGARAWAHQSSLVAQRTQAADPRGVARVRLRRDLVERLQAFRV